MRGESIRNFVIFIVKILLKQRLERLTHICCVSPQTPTDHIRITAVQLAYFHKNSSEFDEMICKLDSTENPNYTSKE